MLLKIIMESFGNYMELHSELGWVWILTKVWQENKFTLSIFCVMKILNIYLYIRVYVNDIQSIKGHKIGAFINIFSAHRITRFYFWINT